jgi:hypothetical protein
MKFNKNTAGFVSLLTCVIISMLLLVITISLTTIENIQLSQAVDSEQSLRAYYTAEAGVEDAVSKILSGTIAPGVLDNQCLSNTTYSVPSLTDPSEDAGWTCQDVSFTGSPVGKLTQADQAVTVAPGHTVPNYDSVLIEWDQSAVAGTAAYNVTGALPTQAQYAAKYTAAPLELAIVQYPDGGFSSNDVCNSGGFGIPAGCTVSLENAVLVPGGTAPLGGAKIPYSTTAGFTKNGPFQANCTGRDATGAANPYGYTGYNCYAMINGLNTGDDYLFRIRSLYLPSSYRMTFFSGANGGGAVVPVPTGQALIDVTAKSGVSYRRVIYNMPITDGAASGLNYVMFSDNDVCKNFDVINNVVQPPGCPY